MKYYKSKRSPKRHKRYIKVYDKIPDNYPKTFRDSKLIYTERVRIEKLSIGSYVIDITHNLSDEQELNNILISYYEETTEEEFNKVLEQARFLKAEFNKVFE